MTMHSFSVYDIFYRNTRLFGKNTALVEGEQRISFHELLKQVDKLAAGLAKEGIGKGDRIAILAHNHHGFFILFGAAAALGAIVVPINWRLSGDEIKHILEDSTPKALIVGSKHEALVQELISKGAPTGRLIGLDASVGEKLSFGDLMTAEPISPTPTEIDDPFCIIYTAAVEGRPRGAVLSHGNIVFGNIQTAAVMELTRRDACLNMLPLFHITGLNLALSVMHMGGKNVVIEKFDEKIVLRETEKENITTWGSFPPILSRCLAEMDADHYDISSLRNVLGIDQPENIKLFEEKTNGKFWILYGQTETSGLVTFSPSSERFGSAGKQGLLTKMKIVDEYDREVPTGESGEIIVQGPLVFKGYWKQNDVNRYVFREGWHHTGDLGRMDEDGYLWFVGRKPEKELIKPGGENVYPVEVEKVILEHPAVAEVSVIGVPDPKFGEGIKAVCVLKPGTVLSADELKEFVASRIARYKKPGYVSFVESLPKTASGTIDREKVKQLHGKAQG